MEHTQIIDALGRNKNVFKELLFELDEQCYRWRPSAEKWNLLEIVCHLRDEEREDFRTRTRHVLEAIDGPPPSIDPASWVKERGYADQDYAKSLDEFLQERESSIVWLQSLSEPQWQNCYEHVSLGPMSAELFLSNWLAHDYLHVRQIIRLKFEYLSIGTGIDLSYAGSW